MSFDALYFATIAAICYVMGSCIKKAQQIDDNYIPEIVCATGVVLGVAAYLLKVPDFPAHDIITAIAVGAWSGFASTGINQLIKQANKGR